jgi:hypothetical protein
MNLFDKALEKIPKYIWRCPILWEWVEFKGETMFAGLNYKRSLKAGRPMIDLFLLRYHRVEWKGFKDCTVRQEKVC